MIFEWDPLKAQENRLKHGLSFEAASQLFAGRGDYLELYDEEHSTIEDRFIAIGPIDRGLIVVVYTERDDDVMRILSARFANAKERAHLEVYWRGQE